MKQQRRQIELGSGSGLCLLPSIMATNCKKQIYWFILHEAHKRRLTVQVERFWSIFHEAAMARQISWWLVIENIHGPFQGCANKCICSRQNLDRLNRKNAFKALKLNGDIKLKTDDRHHNHHHHHPSHHQYHLL